MGQDGPKMAPRWLKMAQDGSKLRQDRPKIASRWLNKTQLGPRAGFSGPQARPQEFLGGSRRLPPLAPGPPGETANGRALYEKDAVVLSPHKLVGGAHGELL